MFRRCMEPRATPMLRCVPHGDIAALQAGRSGVMSSSTLWVESEAEAPALGSSRLLARAGLTQVSGRPPFPSTWRPCCTAVPPNAGRGPYKGRCKVLAGLLARVCPALGGAHLGPPSSLRGSQGQPGKPQVLPRDGTPKARRLLPGCFPGLKFTSDLDRRPQSCLALSRGSMVGAPGIEPGTS